MAQSSWAKINHHTLNWGGLVRATKATPSFWWSTSSNSLFRKGTWEMSVWNDYFTYTWLVLSWLWNLGGKWFLLRTLKVLLYFFFLFPVLLVKLQCHPGSMLCMYITLFLEASRISFLFLMVGKFIMVHPCPLIVLYPYQIFNQEAHAFSFWKTFLYLFDFFSSILSFPRTLTCYILDLLFWFSNFPFLFFSFFLIAGISFSTTFQPCVHCQSLLSGQWWPESGAMSHSWVSSQCLPGSVLDRGTGGGSKGLWSRWICFWAGHQGHII